MATGRPVWSEQTKRFWIMSRRFRTGPKSGGYELVSPVLQPFDRAHVRQQPNIGVEYEPLPLEELRKLNLRGRGRSGGNTIKTTNILPRSRAARVLKAINPTTGEAKWQTGFKSPNWAGTLVTAGGLVFTGTAHRRAHRGRRDTGKILWQFQTSSGSSASRHLAAKRHQYVTVTSGDRNNDNRAGKIQHIANVPMGGSLWTFKLLAQ